MLVDVLLPLNFDRSFTYETNKKVKIGSFVSINFKNKEIIGVIWKLNSKSLDKKIKIKKISKFFDIPPLAKNRISLIEKISNYNLVNIGLVLNLFLYKNGFKSIDKGLKKIQDFSEYSPSITTKSSLNSEQKKILQEIDRKVKPSDYSTNLLQGIPGSGKTHVYFEIIKKALKQNAQVLVMLPEKGLSEQIAERFKSFFNYQPAIWHSGIKDKDKKKIWKGVFKNKIKLVLGARSAMFLPFQKLKLIIIDEEHDGSYKQDEGICYNARDMSILMASIEKFPIYLVSATPSVETYNNVEQKKYNSFNLTTRYNESELPIIQTVKLNRDNISDNNFLSDKITNEVKAYLKSDNQVLFFLNRRGHSTFLFCYKCMKRLECPSCSVGLVYHKKKNIAVCHYCNFNSKLERKCNDDQKCNFKLYGLGLEKIYDEVKNKFPDYEVEALSSDLSDYQKFSDQLKKIEKNQTKIIVATQMISKGFNFKNLNLIVAVNCDTSFLGNDIRSSEKNYQLLYQLSGRAGRFNKKSKIILQTFDDKNKIFDALRKFDPKSFYQNEIKFRKEANLPPFFKFISIIISGRNLYEVEKFALKLKQSLPKNELINIYGPVSATVYKIKYDYRVKILIKYNPKVTPQSFIKNTLNQVKIPKQLKLQVDVDPVNFA
jgi:primosomal protein N' (replication factor Y)